MVYCEFHKVKDFIRSYRQILALLLQSKLDDLVPSLSVASQQRVRDYEKTFLAALNEKIVSLETIAVEVLEEAGTDRKRLVVEVLPARGLEPWQRKFILRTDKSIRDHVMTFAEHSAKKTVNYIRFAGWLGLRVEEEEEEDAKE